MLKLTTQVKKESVKFMLGSKAEKLKFLNFRSSFAIKAYRFLKPQKVKFVEGVSVQPK